MDEISSSIDAMMITVDETFGCNAFNHHFGDEEEVKDDVIQAYEQSAIEKKCIFIPTQMSCSSQQEESPLSSKGSLFFQLMSLPDPAAEFRCTYCILTLSPKNRQ